MIFKSQPVSHICHMYRNVSFAVFMLKRFSRVTYLCDLCRSSDALRKKSTCYPELRGRDTGCNGVIVKLSDEI